MPLELITPDEMARIDARAAELGVPTRTLMENAGNAVAAAVMDRYDPRPTLILCGPGNNGGDGYVAARKLKEAGWPIRVASLTPVDKLKGDAADAACAWSGKVEAPTPETLRDELIIDALFGAGLSRPLQGVAAVLAERAQTVVAVDVPSGVPGDGSKPTGPTFRADLTITFDRKKPAHVLYPGHALCGDIVLADIGVPQRAHDEIAVRLWENQPELWLAQFPRPTWESHKHARGRVAVASGGMTQTGAARLAARAAFRVGAGLVRVLSPPEAVLVNASHLTGIMLLAFRGPDELAQLAEKMDCLVLGPAFGLDVVKPAVAAALKLDKPLVLDADALSAYRDDPAELLSQLHSKCVLTPHADEFKRLFPDLAEQDSKIERTRAAAKRAGCVVLLKGPDTVIAAPDGRCSVNVTGMPYMATAGSGDVLAGLIGGLMGQGIAPWEAACAGAWLHGAAGEALGPGLIAEDLTEAVPQALRRLLGTA